MTLAARLKASCREEDIVFNAQGGLTVKSLDRRNEKLISAVDWHAAARAAEEWTRFHHGATRAEGFVAHHKLVMDLGRSHNWDIAIEYDVQQREVAALNPSHDLSSLDMVAFTIIATRPVTHHVTPALSPLKRSPPSETFQAPKKHQRSHCFHCGGADHFPRYCKADQTVAGKPTAALSPNGRSKNAMLAPNSKHFCFSWAHYSSCCFGEACSNFHGCSICGKSNHGASSCRSHA